MAFKMKASPAKRGDIYGTSGHQSALKARWIYKLGKKIKDWVKPPKPPKKNYNVAKTELESKAKTWKDVSGEDWSLEKIKQQLAKQFKEKPIKD